MAFFRTALAFGLLASTGAFGDVSQKYAPVYYDSAYPGVFAMIGEIGPDTALKFEEAVAAFGRPEVLSLASPGGRVNEVLLIARRVHALGINTHIQSGAECLSACSLIFFGGAVRNAQGDLGLHQLRASNNDPEAIQVSASYIVAALADFEVASDLLVSMLRTPPDDMYIVPEAEKIRYGLMQTAEPARPPDPVPQTTSSLERRSVAFLAEYYRTWSQPNSQAIPGVNALFAAWVDFYGENRSFDEIWAERAELARIFPERRYTLLGDTVSVSCSRPLCYVHGQYRWDARNRKEGTHSSGLSTVSMTLRETGNGFVIVAENGEVLKRD